MFLQWSYQPVRRRRSTIPQLVDPRPGSWQIAQINPLQHGGTDALLEACQSVKAYAGNNYLPLLPKFYKTYRGVLFRLLDLLKMHSATQNLALEKALETIVEHRNRRAKWLPDNLDLSFATELWQKNVRIRKSGKHFSRFAGTDLPSKRRPARGVRGLK